MAQKKAGDSVKSGTPGEYERGGGCGQLGRGGILPPVPFAESLPRSTRARTWPSSLWSPRPRPRVRPPSTCPDCFRIEFRNPQIQIRNLNSFKVATPKKIPKFKICNSNPQKKSPIFKFAIQIHAKLSHGKLPGAGVLCASMYKPVCIMPLKPPT